jgi:predicted transcriptional regulator
LPICGRTLTTKKPQVTLYDRLRKDYPPSLVTLADHLRARRLDLGLTLEQAATTIGTSKALVHEWEKRRKRPAAKWTPNLVRFLGYDPFAEPPGNTENEDIRRMTRQPKEHHNHA